jgi:putative pyridoxal-dependent aspartate 1-decarboxylase
MQLFSGSEQTILAERELDDKLEAIAQAFLHHTAVSTDVEMDALIEQFKTSEIPLEPSDLNGYIDSWMNDIVYHSIHTSSSRYIGHMTSALPYFVRPLGKLMTAMNQNVVKLETSKTLSLCERQALAMMHRLVYGFSDSFYQQHSQNSESTLGMVVTGGTLANLTALWCARNAALGATAQFKGVESEGLPAALAFHGYKDAVIIGSTLMHYSFDKIAGLLGIGDRNLIKIPTDANHQIELPLLQQTVAACQAEHKRILAIVGIAGTTDSGSIDPLIDMAEIAQSVNAHFHVDAAWGGPLLFSEEYRHKLAGIELADSVTIDGHKQLYLPMGLGIVLLRYPQLAKEIEKHAPYTVRQGSMDLGRRALEGSRSGMAILLHTALHVMGRKGYEFLINEGIRQAHYMADVLRIRPEFELLIEPAMNIIVYRYIPERWRQKAAQKQLTASEHQFINQFNKHLQEAQTQAGQTFVSRTTLEMRSPGYDIPIVALRAVIANPLTTEADIHAVLNDQLKIAAKLLIVDA